MKIGILGVGYSLNVGDQLIAKSLGISINSIGQHEVEYFDLHHGCYNIDYQHDAYDFSNYTFPEEKKRSYYIRFAYNLFKTKKLPKESFENFIDDKDLIVIGGGHLLIDNFGDFLSKLFVYSSILRKREKNFVFWSVGVGKEFSPLSRYLLKEITKNKLVYVRDLGSLKNLKDNNILHGKNTYDAAIASAYIECKSEISVKKDSSVTLFIMDTNECKRHSDFTHDRHETAKWWVNVIGGMLEKFDTIYISNNGSVSDVYYINNVVRPLCNKIGYPSSRLVFNEKASSYKDVIRYSEQSDFVVAQRLHSILPCLAREKRVVAIEWDEKVKNILGSLGVSDNLISFDYPSGQVVNLLSESKIYSLKNKVSEYNKMLFELLSGEQF
ncbi:polysaccharide pyruvyl transferase family protein [Vibrio sp. PNB23_22_6]